MKGARILAATLEDGGVEYAFGLAGSAVLGVLDEIAQRDIEFVTTRHEQVAASMAAGYALATRRPTAAISHVGPGAANLMLGVAAAYRDNIPVVAITGNEPSYRLGKDVRHEWDVIEIFGRITKHNVRVTADRPHEQIQDALIRSVTGVPGPVHIDIPRDLEEKNLSAPDKRERESLREKDLRAPMTHSRPPVDVVERTADLLAGAEQPLIIAGNEVRWFDAANDLRRSVELTGVPVATTKNARGALSESQPRSLGLVGRPGMKPTNDYLREADLVIAVGARLSDITTLNWELVDPEAAIVHATLRARELDRHYLADINALADPKSFLSDLNEVCEGRGVVPSFDNVASETRDDYEAARERFLNPEIEPAKEGVDPRKLAQAIDQAAGKYAFTTGGGVHAHFPRRLQVESMNETFVTANFAGMSQGFPLAMGAQLALDRPVFVFEGDGGFAMVMQDLETAVRENIQVKIVVLNNGSFMSQRARQKRYYGGRYIGSTFENPDFAAVAEEFGAFGERVMNDDDIPEAVDRLIAADGPGLLDVRIDPWLDTGGYDRD
jgi:acetolactate synthase-1/2/3 large subunit